MIPERLLRPLTLQTPTYTTDSYGAEALDGYDDSDITGRLDQKAHRENHADGRQAAVSDWLLLTNSADVSANCRIVDGSKIYDVEGTPWPVYAGTDIHHYEATLIWVEG